MDVPAPDQILRIGFVVPRSNTVCETEFNRLKPPGMTFHAARMQFAAGTRGDDMSALISAALKDPLEHLALCDVALTLLACSTASMALTSEAAASLAEKASGGLLDVLEASIQALAELERPRTALFTPYVESGTTALAEVLTRGGAEIVATKSLGLNTSPERFRAVSRIAPEALCREIEAMDLRNAEALFIGCCDLPTLDAIPMLEARLGIPVVSMIQALFRAAMTRIDSKMPLPSPAERPLAIAG